MIVKNNFSFWYMKVVIPTTVPRHENLVFTTPWSEKSRYGQTVWDEEAPRHPFDMLQTVYSSEVVTNCEILKNMLKKCCFFFVFCIKNHEKTLFFEHIFQKFAIGDDVRWTNGLEDVEMMSRGLFVSHGLPISWFLTSGGQKNLIFVSGNGCWNNHLQMIFLILW